MFQTDIRLYCWALALLVYAGALVIMLSDTMFWLVTMNTLPLALGVGDVVMIVGIFVLTLVIPLYD